MNRSQRRAAMKNGKRNRATIVPNRTKKQENADFSDIPLATVCRSIQLLIDELKDRGIRIYDFDNKDKAVEQIQIICEKVYFLAAKEEENDGKVQEKTVG